MIGKAPAPFQSHKSRSDTAYSDRIKERSMRLGELAEALSLSHRLVADNSKQLFRTRFSLQRYVANFEQRKATRTRSCRFRN